MKKLSCLLLLFIFFQCNKNVFTIPDLETTFQPPEVNTSIKALHQRVLQNDPPFIRLEEGENTLWMEGYVTSSDAGGNFYKEIYLQDAPSQPQSALRILLDQTALYNLFPPGRKVYIKLNGLAAGLHKGVLTLGEYNADGIENLSFHLIESHLIRSDEDFQIEPLVLEVSDFDEYAIGKWVSVSGVQFSDAERGRTFAAQAHDQFDGERRLLDCNTHHNLWVSTSTFSKFKSVVVPEQSGILSGILTRDYYNEKFIIKINSPNDIDFKEGRCDLFFEQHFETASRGKLEIARWLNYTQEGSPYWKVVEEETSLGRSASISAYASGDDNSVVWLISPALDLDQLTRPYFAFRSAVRYGDRSKLEVFLSRDFSGLEREVTRATWQQLDMKIASRMDGNDLWIDSGNFDLSDQQGKVYFGFKYTGSGKTTYDATFLLDDIRIAEQRP